MIRFPVLTILTVFLIVACQSIGIVPQIGHNIRIRGLTFSFDGHYLASIADDPDFYIRIWDLKEKKVIKFIEKGGNTSKIQFSPINNILLFNNGNSIQAIGIGNDFISKPFYHPGGEKIEEKIDDFTLSPGGKFLLLISPYNVKLEKIKGKKYFSATPANFKRFFTYKRGSLYRMLAIIYGNQQTRKICASYDSLCDPFGYTTNFSQWIKDGEIIVYSTEFVRYNGKRNLFFFDIKLDPTKEERGLLVETYAIPFPSQWSLHHLKKFNRDIVIYDDKETLYIYSLRKEKVIQEISDVNDFNLCWNRELYVFHSNSFEVYVFKRNRFHVRKRIPLPPDTPPVITTTVNCRYNLVAGGDNSGGIYVINTDKMKVDILKRNTSQISTFDFNNRLLALKTGNGIYSFLTTDASPYQVNIKNPGSLSKLYVVNNKIFLVKYFPFISNMINIELLSYERNRFKRLNMKIIKIPHYKMMLDHYILFKAHKPDYFTLTMSGEEDWVIKFPFSLTITPQITKINVCSERNEFIIRAHIKNFFSPPSFYAELDHGKLIISSPYQQKNVLVKLEENSTFEARIKFLKSINEPDWISDISQNGNVVGISLWNGMVDYFCSGDYHFEKIARFYINDRTGDWVVYLLRKPFFESNKIYTDLIIFREGTKIVRVKKIYRDYFKKGLLKSVLQGELCR